MSSVSHPIGTLDTALGHAARLLAKVPELAPEHGETNAADEARSRNLAVCQQGAAADAGGSTGPGTRVLSGGSGIYVLN